MLNKHQKFSEDQIIPLWDAIAWFNLNIKQIPFCFGVSYSVLNKNRKFSIQQIESRNLRKLKKILETKRDYYRTHKRICAKFENTEQPKKLQNLSMRNLALHILFKLL